MVDKEMFVIIFIFRMAETKGLLEKVICESILGNINCTDTPCSILNITDANFGRTSVETCKHSNGNATDCRSSNSTTIVRDICQGRVICPLGANNSIFGDPCSGISKYLEIHFDCIDTDSCSTTLESSQTSSSTSVTTTIMPVVSSVTTHQIQISPDSYSETRSTPQLSKLTSLVSSGVAIASQSGSSHISTTKKHIVTIKTTATLRVGILDISTVSSVSTAFVAAKSSPLSSTSTVATTSISSSSGFFGDPRRIAMVSAVAGVVIIGTAAASAYAYFSHGGILPCESNSR